MIKYNLFFFALILLLPFFPSDQNSNQQHINSNTLYSHKGKCSLGGAFLFSLGINTIFKKFSLINQYSAIKKYNNLSLYKKFFLGVPLSSAFSLVSYIGLSNFPFKGEKYTGFAYPKNNNFILDREERNIVHERLKELGLEVSPNQSINDASYLNRTNVSAIIKVSKEEDIKNVLKIAFEDDLKVAIAGARHSMGGQAFVNNGLILDMSNFKAMSLVDNNESLTVQSGALFADIQHFLDEKGLSVKAMQSVNFCTVGGTVAANAHGIAHDPGCIGSTIKSMRIMRTDGTIYAIKPSEKLFGLVVGGYGLAAIILDVTLEVVPNQMYEWKRAIMDYRDFPKYFRKNIENKNNIGLFHGRLSVSPFSYLTEVFVNTYEEIDSFIGPVPKIRQAKDNWMIRPLLEFSKTGAIGRFVRMTLEKYVYPLMTASHVSRNQQMYNKMSYLKNPSQETEILQEYFVSPEKMAQFVDTLREIIGKYEVNLLNVTIRSVKKDTLTALPYAKEDMLAFVLYFNQKLNEHESTQLKEATEELIGTVVRLDGTFYLPYKLYYSKNQLTRAYPNIDNFFEFKRQYDPQEILSNTFYEKYKEQDAKLEDKKLRYMKLKE